MDVQVQTKRPKSKYALKREKRLVDLTQEEPVSMSMFVRKEDMLKKPQSIKDVIKDRLYSKEGAECFHRGNAFALAFNKEVNR